MEYKKYLTIVGYKEYGNGEDPMIIFGVDIYSKSKKRAEEASEILNFPHPTFEICEVLYSPQEEDLEDLTDFSLN